MKELSTSEIRCINGAMLPALMWGLGYVGALQVAADFGAGLGSGLYDVIHQ
ncbi:hypothetical protein [Alteromonas sp. 14N.309.X.WAT.G.H12]|uniref:hypothetical protein n=1 Tax=Alteromonas sp. 14N.309.X.WAT.G.H12 TaxID=3120824 RepID=UPI002FD36265